MDIGDFSDVAQCLTAAAIGSRELVGGEILNPDYAAILASSEAKGLGKCADAIIKNAGKALDTIGKERSKAQNGIEKTSAAVTASYTQHTVNNPKINDAITKMNAAIDKACRDSNKALFTTSELVHLGSCSAASVAAIESCVEQAVRNTGEGAISMAYVNAGELPIQADVFINSGTTTTGGGSALDGVTGSRRNRTQLDAGFTVSATRWT
jgi:hypothetical protein